MAASSEEPILVSKALAARLLSISVDTFERAVMPDIRRVRIGRRVLFTITDLGAWVEQHSAVPLASEIPRHACEIRHRKVPTPGSLPPRRRGIVDRTTNRRGGAGLSPAPRP